MVLPPFRVHDDGFGSFWHDPVWEPVWDELLATSYRLLYDHYRDPGMWHGREATTTCSWTRPLIKKRRIRDIMRWGQSEETPHRHDAHERATNENYRQHKDDHQRNVRRITGHALDLVGAQSERRKIDGDLGDVKATLGRLKRAVFGQSEIGPDAVHKYGTLISIVNKHKDLIKDNAQEIADVALGGATERETLRKRINDLDGATAKGLTRQDDVFDTHARMISELDRALREQRVYFSAKLTDQHTLEEKNRQLEAQCADLRRRVGHTEAANAARVTDICDLLVKVAALEGKKNPFVLGGPSECEIEAVVKEITEDTVAHLIYRWEVKTKDCKNVIRTYAVEAADAGAAVKKVHQLIDDNCTCEPKVFQVVRGNQKDIVGHRP